MLTNQEALRLIQQCDACYVVWAIDQNAVVAVYPLPANATAQDRSQALAAMQTDYQGPTKGRFFNSQDVTLQTLQDEQTETDRVATRGEIFISWKNCGIAELIDIVVERRFYAPMDVRHGSSHIIERLYKLHGPQLTQAQLARLEQFAQATDAPYEQKSAQAKLKCYLAVLRNDPERLRTIWERRHCPNADWSTWSEFTAAAGDLPTENQGIINQLIEVVETPFMFGPRYAAMVALGKIGPPAGKRAVEVIKASIYDSSEHIATVRERVIARIQQAESVWTRCPGCNRGYVEGMSFGIPSVQSCAGCLGLGYVLKSTPADAARRRD